MKETKQTYKMCTYIKGIETGNKNYKLYKDIKYVINTCPTRKEIVSYIIKHDNFIYKNLHYKRRYAWQLYKTVKKIDNIKPYKIDLDNRMLFVLWYNLDVIPYKGSINN